MLAIFSWLVLQFRLPSLVALGEGVAGSFLLLQVPDPFQCGRDKLLLFGRRGDVSVVAGSGTLHHSLVKQLSEQEGWIPLRVGPEVVPEEEVSVLEDILQTSLAPSMPRLC